MNLRLIKTKKVKYPNITLTETVSLARYAARYLQEKIDTNTVTFYDIACVKSAIKTVQWKQSQPLSKVKNSLRQLLKSKCSIEIQKAQALLPIAIRMLSEEIV